tara:strand:+ start:576 stop:698 length:123 start_codon:yes stop_codon:yes gene_type:complete
MENFIAFIMDKDILYFIATVCIFAIVGWSILYLDDDNAEM